MKSILVSRWWLVIGLVSLVGNNLYGQNSFPTYGDVLLGWGYGLQGRNSVSNFANLIRLDGSNFVSIAGTNSNGVFIYNGTTMVLSVRGDKVGVRVDWPSYDLDVNGTIKCNQLRFADGTSMTTAGGGSSTCKWTPVGYNIFYSGGSVGIGKTPDFKLDVNGTIRCSELRFSDGTVQSTAGGGGSLTSQWITSGSNIHYDSGNVGIGTGAASPLQKLDVRGRMLVSYPGFAGSSRTAPSEAGSIVELVPGDYEGARNCLIYTGREQNVEKLMFDPGSGLLMTLSGGGKVGIGTNAPTEKLSVVGMIQSTTGGFKFPDGTVQTTAGGGGGAWTTNGSDIYNSNNGSVGIGKSPSQKLDVAGAIAVSGTSVIDANRNIVNAASGAFAGNMNVGGTVIIGNRATTSYKLDIVGNVRANEVVVNTDGSDFVFDERYKLMDLARLADFIKENKHLPEMATAGEMQKSGIGVGDMQTKLLQKIEELTLYVIDQEKRIQEQNRRIEKLEEENAELLSKQ